MKLHILPAVLSFGFILQTAHAQVFHDLIDADMGDISDIIDAVMPGVSNIRLGAGLSFSPDYEGANSYDINPKPMISLRYRDLIQIDNNNIRINLFGDDGLFDSKTFTAGPLLKIASGRDESDNKDLTGLGDVGRSIELGIFISAYLFEDLRARIRLQHDISSSGHSGTKLIGDIRYLFTESEDLIITGTINAVVAGDKYMDAFFSITDLQSQRSGLPRFDAGSGLKSISAALAGNYSISRHWAMVANAGYGRLFGDAKSSPLVRQRGTANQFSGGLYAVYVF